MQHTPNTALERLKGKVKKVAGAVVGDDQLAHEGELHESKAEAVERAAHLEAEASADSERAQLEARRHDMAVERAELSAEAEAERRELQLEDERRSREAEIERDATRRAESAHRQEQIERDAVRRDAARAGQEHIETARRAAAMEIEAERSRRAADALGTAADRIAGEDA